VTYSRASCVVSALLVNPKEAWVASRKMRPPRWVVVSPSRVRSAHHSSVPLLLPKRVRYF